MINLLLNDLPFSLFRQNTKDDEGTVHYDITYIAFPEFYNTTVGSVKFSRRKTLLLRPLT